jgi:hypothetical protein
MKKIKYYLQLVDGIWSVPLAIAGFWLIGSLFTAVFGLAAGTYDIGFWQPLFLAAGIVIGATNIAVWGMYFTFRGLYRYLYGQKIQERDEKGVLTGKEIRINYSKKDWLKLPISHRYLVAFGVFTYFVSAIIIVYLQFV